MNYTLQKQENAQRIRNYRINPSDGEVDYYPSYIQLEHTNRCNAQCIMCNHFYLGNRGANDISDEVIDLLEPILPFCQSIMLNGDGEPFLCRNIEKYLRLYHKYNIRVGTNTNLCALTPEMFSILGESIDFINISCDSYEKETFERIRNGLDYSLFIGNLKRLNIIAPKIRKNLDCVLMVQNIIQTPDIVVFASEFGFDSVKFNLLGVNPCISNGDDSVLNCFNAASYYLKLAAKKAKELDIEITYPQIFNHTIDENLLEIEQRELLDYDWSVIERRKLLCKKQYPNASLENDYLGYEVDLNILHREAISAPKTCQWGLERCYIDVAGNITTCCYNVQYYMGNLLRAGSFDKIWNSSMYQQFRINMLKGNLPNWCKECGYYWGQINTNFAGELMTNEDSRI